jgi:CRP-like cAMP-binding protein
LHEKKKGALKMDQISGTFFKKYRFFSSLSDGALEALSNKVQPVELPKGTEIIKEGTVADAFYLIWKGEVEVTKKTDFGQIAKLSYAGPGESFGEMALLTNLPRSSTVIAKTDVRLFKISMDDFEEIINFDTAFSSLLERQAQSYSDFNKLKTLQPLALIEPEKMLALIEKMEEKKYSPGENIIIQGEKGDNYYIVKSGRVAVIQKSGDKEPEQIAELKSGAGFGEEAIIREKARNATVRAIDETIVLILDKANFEGILRKTFVENAFPEDIPEHERDRYVYIDARIPPEYEEEHIAGAVNIPIEVLREKFGELDKSKKYYTYCLNDSRGMTAAFLMKSMGYDVQVLRGGLSAWDGPTSRGKDGIHTPLS